MRAEANKCHDCGVKEGEIHHYGCDMERCPFCGCQLLSCDCCYTLLGYEYDRLKPLCGLPKSIYENGLTPKQQVKWELILNKKGRIPYIILPNYCRRCLKPYPEMFKVPDEEWNKLPLNLRDHVLCKECYNKIKGWIAEVPNEKSKNC